MCRWLAYSGSPVLIEDLLFKPAHSLVDQSLHSRLGAETTNGDGFGIGWYGTGDTPGLYHCVEPAWNERNLRELAAHVTSPLVFAHIRASSAPGRTAIAWYSEAIATQSSVSASTAGLHAIGSRRTAKPSAVPTAKVKKPSRSRRQPSSASRRSAPSRRRQVR